MRDLAATKFRPMEVEVAAEKGDFELFALFLREDSPGKWDLIVAAPWIVADKREALFYLSRQVKQKLGPTELPILSRIVILEKGDRILEDLLVFPEHEHSVFEFTNCRFNDLVVKHAFVITSKRRPWPKRRRQRSAGPKD
jgi:hypothetical protein